MGTELTLYQWDASQCVLTLRELARRYSVSARILLAQAVSTKPLGTSLYLQETKRALASEMAEPLRDFVKHVHDFSSVLLDLFEENGYPREGFVYLTAWGDDHKLVKPVIYLIVEECVAVRWAANQLRQLRRTKLSSDVERSILGGR